jgi:hypothetical protein
VLRKVVQQINRPDAPVIDNDHLPD